MKIYYFVSSFKVSGLTKIIYNTAKELMQEHEVTIVELNAIKTSEFKDELLTKGLDFIDLDFKGFNFLEAKRKIKALIDEQEPDIVHAHCFRSIVALSLIKTKKTKTICTMHSYIPYNYVGEFGVIKAKIFSNLLISRARKFDAVISVSNSVKKLYSDINKLTTVSICNGVEVFDKKINFSNQYDYIYTGSVSERKKTRELCLAFQSFLEQYPDEKLLILGDGPLLIELKNRFSSSNIIFLGRVSNVNLYISKSRFFVSASESEGLPNSVMEAMSMGLPCVLSDIPPHNELVSDVQNRYISTFDYNNLDSIIHSLNQSKRLSEEEYSKISNDLKLEISTKYNIETMARGHEVLYKNLL